MRNIFRLTVLATLAMIGTGAIAQSSIPLSLRAYSSSVSLGSGGDSPIVLVTTDLNWLPTGESTERFQPCSYIEWRVNCTTPGLYSIDIPIYNLDCDDGFSLTFETKKYTNPEDVFATRFASRETTFYPKTGCGDPWWRFVPLGTVTDADSNVITVPLWEGENVFRVQNISGRHTAAYTYPPILNDINNRPWGQFWSNLHLGGITLNRVSDLPAMGTITGTVTGNKPSGVSVKRAIVCANPPGKSPTEPSNFWKYGYYTYSTDGGTYSITAPIGSTDVKAGRPSSYRCDGSEVANVVVEAATPKTANLALESIWLDDGDGFDYAYIQNEYFDYKNGNMGLLSVDGWNGFKVGWIDPNDSTSMIVDVPKTGLYQVTSSYFNGGGTGLIRVSTDLGSTVEADQPNTANDWGRRLEITYPNSIYLLAGANIVTQTLLSGNSDQDGFKLQLLPDVPTLGNVTGTVTDRVTGGPVAGATVTLGGNTVKSDTTGKYVMVANAGTGQKLTVTHPFAESSALVIVDVTANATTTVNVVLTVRPNIELSTNSGHNWQVLVNTGSAADYSAVGADESAFVSVPVPGDFRSVKNIDEVYAWYRLHFTPPTDFASLMPGRKAVFRVVYDPTTNARSINDVDEVWINGTRVGGSGSFPSSVEPPQPDPHTLGDPANYAPGLTIDNKTERSYFFPASLLTSGDNVIAVKVYDHASPGGITGLPRLEISWPTGTVTGTVKAAGVGVPNVRVAANDPTGISSDWTLTDANGAFTLSHVAVGPVIIGAVKPGYTAVMANAGSLAEGATINLDLVTSSLGADPAPSYDEFNGTGTDWQTKWDALSLVAPDPSNAPVITMPGVDVNNSGRPEIPGTLTIDGGLQPRGALLSKVRLNKFASVASAKFVSALPATPEPTGTLPNLILYASGNPEPNVNNWSFISHVELDIEGYAIREEQQRTRYMIWSDMIGDNMSLGPAPTFQNLFEVTPETPIILTMTRTGSYWDFYINGEHVYGGNFVKSPMADHKVGLYSYQTSSSITADWAKFSGVMPETPVPGDLNGNGIVDNGDSLSALRIAAGLLTATPTDLAVGNVAGADTVISILDAMRIAQAANGAPL